MRRSIQRKWKQSLAGVALLLTLGQTPALAAAINVCETCTLARAITSANNECDTSPQGICTPGLAQTVLCCLPTAYTPHRSRQLLLRVYGAARHSAVSAPLMGGTDQCDGGAPTTGDTAVNCEQLSNVP